MSLFLHAHISNYTGAIPVMSNNIIEKKRGFFVNNGDYKNKKTFNNQGNKGSYSKGSYGNNTNKPTYNKKVQSNGNFNKKKNNNNDSRDDIYTPKTYPKKEKISQFDAILDSLQMPEYMCLKNEANEKRQRDLKYKRSKRR